jgi:hypothetical protein
MKDDILMTMFGGGTLDWEMLDKCEYDFEDIYEDMKMFCSSYEDFDFNSILLGAIDLYKYHIQDKIDEKITETESDLKELERYIDENNGNVDIEYVDDKKRLEQQLEDLQSLYASDDIEYFTNYLDTSIFIVNDEVRALYKKYLEEEVEKENELIGFCYLDLD